MSALRAGTTSIMEVVLRRVSSPIFVGRAEELAALDTALARSSEGVPTFAFVAGESGVGKSRLVAEFEARAAQAGARVLVGHCLELGGTVFPYAPLVEALRSAGESLPDAGSQPHVFEALLALLDRLGPVALVLEDLHWADQSTRDFLVFLVRSARTEALCLLVTYRSDELHRRHPLRPVLAELERLQGVQRIALERFSREEVGEQLAGILGGPPDDDLADRLYARGRATRSTPRSCSRRPPTAPGSCPPRCATRCSAASSGCPRPPRRSSASRRWPSGRSATACSRPSATCRPPTCSPRRARRSPIS